MDLIKMNKIERTKYDKKRYQQLRAQQIIALGSFCVACGKLFSYLSYDLVEVHHIKPYLKRSRTRAKAYFSTNREEVELRCKTPCHVDTPNYRGRKE